MSGCVYLGEQVKGKKCKQDVYQCFKFSCHVVQGKGSRTVPGCLGCKHRLVLSDPEFRSKWEDPLIVLDRHRKRCSALRGMLAGRSVFLACGGPSANDLPLERLNERGIWTFAVNNMAGHSRFKANGFVCSDPLVKFSHSIWYDPAIMKFVPTPKLTNKGRGFIKRKVGPGSFETVGTVMDCPNVWGFQRNPWLWPDHRFFTENGAAWGNQDIGVKKTGEKKTVNTMLLAMRILRYLGASRVFMIGVDFRMGANYGYAFDQTVRHKRQGVWDNSQYEITNEWLCRMQEAGVFEQFGIEFYNCFWESSLRAFPYVPFERAIVECKGFVENEPDLSEWYDKAKGSDKKKVRRR